MKKKSINVFFFGDSICFGQGVSIHKGWVTRISRDLEEIAFKSGLDITVINSGVNGNTTRLALERMPYDVQSHRPDILVVQFGMNDCNYWNTDGGVPRVSANAFEANLMEIAARARKFGAQKIFFNTNHPTTRTDTIFDGTDITYEQSNALYNNLIRKVVSNLGDVVGLHDVESEFNQAINTHNLELSTALQADRLHLSEVGHSIYYSLINESIKRSVSELMGIAE